jgi:hypothetical protein
MENVITKTLMMTLVVAPGPVPGFSRVPTTKIY